MRRVALGILGTRALAATAGAHHNGTPQISHYVRDDGTGSLIANPGGHPLTWERCPPEGPCERLDHAEQVLETGDPPPGTTFVATQDGVSARSEPWRGLVHATAPPWLEGEPVVGALVRPQAATWAGGWGREADWLQLQACRTRAGEGCVVLIDEIKYGKCEPEGGRYLPRHAAGRWLRVVDIRIDRSQPFTSEGYGFPEAVRPLEPTGPGVAAATSGPVRDGKPRRSGCPARPRVQLSSIWLPQPIAGVVTCPGGCRIEVIVRQRRRTIRNRYRGRYVTLEITQGQARRLRPGRARVEVRVDGRLARTRMVTVSAPRS